MSPVETATKSDRGKEQNHTLSAPVHDPNWKAHVDPNYAMNNKEFLQYIRDEYSRRGPLTNGWLTIAEYKKAVLDFNKEKNKSLVVDEKSITGCLTALRSMRVIKGVPEFGFDLSFINGALRAIPVTTADLQNALTRDFQIQVQRLVLDALKRGDGTDVRTSGYRLGYNCNNQPGIILNFREDNITIPIPNLPGMDPQLPRRIGIVDEAHVGDRPALRLPVQVNGGGNMSCPISIQPDRNGILSIFVKLTSDPDPAAQYASFHYFGGTMLPYNGSTYLAVQLTREIAQQLQQNQGRELMSARSTDQDFDGARDVNRSSQQQFFSRYGINFQAVLDRTLQALPQSLHQQIARSAQQPHNPVPTENPTDTLGHLFRAGLLQRTIEGLKGDVNPEGTTRPGAEGYRFGRSGGKPVIAINFRGNNFYTEIDTETSKSIPPQYHTTNASGGKIHHFLKVPVNPEIEFSSPLTVREVNGQFKICIRIPPHDAGVATAVKGTEIISCKASNIVLRVSWYDIIQEIRALQWANQ